MTVPPWTEAPCIRCGCEGWATRTEPRETLDDYVCSDCDQHERGYRAGLAAMDDRLRGLAKLWTSHADFLDEAAKAHGQRTGEGRAAAFRECVEDLLALVGDDEEASD